MSVNKWIGIGNLTRDPESRFTPSGTEVCNFSIACNDRFKDREGNKQESVEYVNIVAWRQLAEICGKYLQKGKQIYVEGKLKTRKWQDRNGVDRYTPEIVIDTMQMLGSASDSQQNTGAGQNAGQSQQQNNAQAPGNTGGYAGQNQGQPQPQNGPSGYSQQSGPSGYGQPQNNGQPGGVPGFNPDDSIPF